jgi:hypothetical protein
MDNVSSSSSAMQEYDLRALKRRIGHGKGRQRFNQSTVGIASINIQLSKDVPSKECIRTNMTYIMDQVRGPLQGH